MSLRGNDQQIEQTVIDVIGVNMAMSVKKNHPILSGFLASIPSFLAGAFFFMDAHYVCATSGVILGVILGLMGYFCELKSRIAKCALCGLLIFLLGIVPCIIFLGGIDIDPIDDKDLELPENDVPYDPDGNGWAMLSNVLSQIETIEDELYDDNGTNNCLWGEAYLASKDLLCWYADPTNREDALCWIGGDREEYLSNFTNRVTACSYVEFLLKSNEWLFAGIDSVIRADRYVPPPVRMLTGGQFCLPICGMITVNRCFLLARVRYEFDRGNYNAGVEAFQKALGLATLLQMKCGDLFEYLVGSAMIANDVSCLNQILDDTPVPVSTLSSIYESLCALRGFTPEAMSHALKREYARHKANSRLPRGDVLYPEKSQLYKVVDSPIARYVYHPNRTLRDWAIHIRELIEVDFKIREHQDQKPKETKWYDVFIPNCFGRIDHWWFVGQILSRAKETEKDISSLKAKISRMMDSIGNHHRTRSYFPLVLTNGCYFTHDLKHIVGVAESSESIVVGRDVEIGEAADFSHVKKIIVTPECEGWLETWYDALKDPTNLVDVCVGDDVAEIGKTGNLIYEQKWGRIINIFGNEKSATIPENVVVPDIDKFVEQLQWHGVERLHFCGSLPTFNRRETKDSFVQRIAHWWEVKTWKRFKKIFAKRKTRYALDRAPHGLVVTVSRQHADERTRQIVESGMWEGRPIRWSESNE